MIYIVDANNLAGKLKMLGVSNFDKKLIALIEKYITGNPPSPKLRRVNTNPWILVFDSNDPMGDKRAVTEYLTVVYSPKDKYYESADDKIVEIVERLLSQKREQLTVYSDDVGLRKRIEHLAESLGKDIILERATSLAEKLKGRFNRQSPLAGDSDATENGKRGLGKKERKKINDELLGIWK